jgi:hypothetical protein
MGEIEWTIYLAGKLAEAGKEYPDMERYVKAFRLVRFGRCPSCDHPQLMRLVYAMFDKEDLACRYCGFKVTLEFPLFMAKTVNQVVLEIVDLGMKYAKERKENKDEFD